MSAVGGCASHRQGGASVVTRADAASNSSRLTRPAARLADFMAADLSALDLLVVQIDRLHLGGDLVACRRDRS